MNLFIFTISFFFLNYFIYFVLKKLNILISINNITPAKSSLYSNLFKLVIIFFLTVGFLGVISNISYYFNKSISFVVIIFYFFSSLGLVSFFLQQKNQSIDFKDFLIKDNKFLWSIIFFILLIYFNRIFVEWNDQDEISQYGYYTKLYAQGWVFKDNVFGLFPRFAEISFSLFYYVTDNFILARLIRFLIFIGCLIIFYITCLVFCKSKKISVLTSIIFILIPELSYVGYHSMKTDFLLFAYELTSIIFLIHLYKNIFFENKNNKEIYIPDIAFLSVLFGFLAFSSRLSGIYVLLISCIIFLIQFFISNKKKSLINFFYLIFLFLLISFPQIFFNLINFQNPFYPLNGFWINFFSDPMYSQGWSVEYLQNSYNLSLGIPILNEIYILIYNSLGLSRTYFGFIQDYIINPKGYGSTGWLSPVTLIIFVTPFYFKKFKILIFLTFLFLLLFLLWKSNIQYTRIFLASSCIVLVIFSIILNYEKSINSWFYFLLKGLSYSTIFVLLLYHLEVSLRENPYGYSMLTTKNNFENNFIKSTNRDNWDKYISKKILNYNDKINSREEISKVYQNYFNYNDINEINKTLKNFEKITILHKNRYFENLNTLFKYGYVNFEKNIDVSQIKSSKKICLLDFDNSFEYFGKIYFSNSKNVKLRCII
tara:strand:+ start:5688 stop:7649 length:1962 start_codon:yes stop_codon:yes gene_type:complete